MKGTSFPKSDLTKRLYSTGRKDVLGALTKDSPAAAQAYAQRRKQNKRSNTSHPLSRSLPSHPTSSSKTQPPSNNSDNTSPTASNLSLLNSASQKTIFNSTLPPRQPQYRGQSKAAWAKNSEQDGSSSSKRKPVGPGAPYAPTTNSMSSTLMAGSSKMESSKYEENNSLQSFSKIETKPPTFTESLQLDEHYLEEFLGGNFVYLRPKIGLQRTAYDLECVEHFETNPDDYYTMSREGITHFGSDESEFTYVISDEKKKRFYFTRLNNYFFSYVNITFLHYLLFYF